MDGYDKKQTWEFMQVYSNFVNTQRLLLSNPFSLSNEFTGYEIDLSRDNIEKAKQVLPEEFLEAHGEILSTLRRLEEIVKRRECQRFRDV